ncbi:hypothetical protein PPROV_000397100 [Pycnococcus provasolii]|uniref:Uncharacterized protein n=1 Tax=Pycnococcus provasolii TaxID=41880 RepID=A0A830HIV5_9CHLO|nr:hypothetical protein PPROV_000397100 [Pycnococcus provasolii]
MASSFDFGGGGFSLRPPPPSAYRGEPHPDHNSKQQQQLSHVSSHSGGGVGGGGGGASSSSSLIQQQSQQQQHKNSSGAPVAASPFGGGGGGGGMDSYLRTLDAIATSCAHTHQLAKTRRKEADKMLKGMDQGTLTMANNANVPRNSNDAAERMNRRAEVNSLKVVEDRLNTIQKHLDALRNSCTHAPTHETFHERATAMKAIEAERGMLVDHVHAYARLPRADYNLVRMVEAFATSAEEQQQHHLGGGGGHHHQQQQQQQKIHHRIASPPAPEMMMEPPPTEIVKGRARQAIRQLRVARKYSQEMRQQRNSWDTASYEMEKYADAEVALMTSIMSPKMRDSEIKADALRRSGESYDELQHRTRQPLPTRRTSWDASLSPFASTKDKILAIRERRAYPHADAPDGARSGRVSRSNTSDSQNSFLRSAEHLKWKGDGNSGSGSDADSIRDSRTVYTSTDDYPVASTKIDTFTESAKKLFQPRVEDANEVSNPSPFRQWIIRDKASDLSRPWDNSKSADAVARRASLRDLSGKCDAADCVPKHPGRFSLLSRFLSGTRRTVVNCALLPFKAVSAVAHVGAMAITHPVRAVVSAVSSPQMQQLAAPIAVLTYASMKRDDIAVCAAAVGRALKSQMGGDSVKHNNHHHSHRHHRHRHYQTTKNMAPPALCLPEPPSPPPYRRRADGLQQPLAKRPPAPLVYEAMG